MASLFVRFWNKNSLRSHSKSDNGTSVQNSKGLLDAL